MEGRGYQWRGILVEESGSATAGNKDMYSGSE